MRKLILVVMLVTLAACGNEGDEDATTDPSPSATFPIATVLLDNGAESTLVTVEVAETPQQQATVLSERDSLPDDEGVVLVFFEERETGVEVNGAAIPLSVAYFDARGTIVGIVEAEPCSDDSCTVASPDAPYMGALAVNAGMYAEWDITEGDHVQLTR